MYVCCRTFIKINKYEFVFYFFQNKYVYGFTTVFLKSFSWLMIVFLANSNPIDFLNKKNINPLNKLVVPSVLVVYCFGHSKRAKVYLCEEE